MSTHGSVSQKQALVCICVKCGRSFAEPIELSVVQVDSSAETYHACPRCFSRAWVTLVDTEVKRIGSLSDNKSKKRSGEAPSSASEKGLQERADGAKKIEPVSCAHFIGYLRTRQKDSPIPDECLICTKILECTRVQSIEESSERIIVSKKVIPHVKPCEHPKVVREYQAKAMTKYKPSKKERERKKKRLPRCKPTHTRLFRRA